jgi:dynein heavy chain, axonemal
VDCWVQQLQLFLNDNEEIPWAVLQFLEAEINYGGRVTNDKDRRLLDTIVRTYTCKQVLEHNFLGHYFSPETETLGGVLDYIRNLLLNPRPGAFGLHDNADFMCAQNETFALMDYLLPCQPKSVSASGAKNDLEIINLATDILKRIPVSLDIVKAHEMYPTDYHQSMNTVLT